MTAQTHDTMYYPNGRVPYYYYDQWYDTTYYYAHDTLYPKLTAPIWTSDIFEGHFYASYAVETCVSDPILLKGVAVLTADSTMDYFLPHYWIPHNGLPMAPDTVFLFTYDPATNVKQILGTARWDNSETVKIWRVPLSINPNRPDSVNYIKVFEAEFPQPLAIDTSVCKSFYIGSTYNSIQSSSLWFWSFMYNPHYYVTISCPDIPKRVLACVMYSLVNDGSRDPESGSFDVTGGPFLSEGLTGFLPILDTTVEYVLLKASSADTAMGTAAPKREMVRRWMWQRVTATPRPGYQFDRWNDGSRENPHRVQVTTDSVHYVATFRIGQFWVAADAADKDAGWVLGERQYNGFDTAMLVVNANAGYRFSHWNDGVTDNPRHVVVLSDTQFVAYFEVDTSGGDDTVAAHAPVAEAAVTVTPNPTTGWVTVTAVEGTTVQVEAFDAQGRRVAAAKGDRGTARIDLGGQPAGEYILHIALPDGRTVRRVVKR